jgi:hypothetical protein
MAATACTPPDAEDLVSARHVHRHDDRRVGLALIGRRRRDDALAARNLGRDHTHVRRCDQRVFAAGHVAADGAHRQMLVAQHHPRQRLDLYVSHRVALDLGEVSDLHLGEADVGHRLRVKRGVGRFDLRLIQAKGSGVPVVEPRRPVAHGGVAALADVAEDRFHGGADLGVRFGRGVFRDAGLEVTRHCPLPRFPKLYKATVGLRANAIHPHPTTLPAPGRPQARLSFSDSSGHRVGDVQGISRRVSLQHTAW